jgi:hypothetical protein
VTSGAIDSDAKAWAASLAARLRLIQSGFEADEPVTREGFLTEEIERALKPLPPSRRPTCLNALEDEFPAWEPELPETAPAHEPSLDELVKLLQKLGPTLSDETRGRIALELIASKVIPESAKPAPSGQYEDFWKRFGRSGATPPSTERSLRLLALLSEFFVALDQLAWTLWRNVGAKSAYRKEFEFQKISGPYVAGDAEVSSDQMRQTVERTRKLVAALLGAPSRGAADFASAHSAAFAPESIEVSARQEKRALESLDAASWRLYKERFKNAGAALQVENAIQLAVGRAAEDLIGGRAR